MKKEIKSHNHTNQLFTRKKTTIIIALAIVASIFAYVTLNSVHAMPWSPNHKSWNLRKQLTLVNNANVTLNTYTTYQISLDTRTLYQAGTLKANCDDIRVVYQPNGSTNTELKRAILIPNGATSCADSTSTTIVFPLQAAISSGSSNSSYYLYYNNPSAPSYSITDSLASYNIGNKTATLVAPLMSSTYAFAAGSGTATTSTGPIRFHGSQSSINLNGRSDYIDTGSSPSSFIGTAATSFTIEGWFKLRNENTTSYWASQYILGADANTVGCGGGEGPIYVEHLSSTQRRLKFALPHSATDTCQSATAVDFNQYDTDPLQYDRWYYFAATYDATTKKMKTYLNGVYFAQGTWGGASTITWNTNLFIGKKGGGLFYNGGLDEMRISNVIRYTSNFTPPSSRFVKDANTTLLYHFDENGGLPYSSGCANGKACDDSGNGYHGTISGTVGYSAGLIGLDNSSTDTGSISSQNYAGKAGAFIEQSTTNKVTNPSFENASTYDTGWTAAGTNLTATSNTTLTYVKFGATSQKLVANASAISGTSNMRTISINAGNTNTHTLSFYAYDGTSGNGGGTISNSIIRPVFKGVSQSTATYTQLGSGWWRVTYSGTGTASGQEYGVEVQVSKTVYIDGVQLEESGFPTSYADGSLGSGYTWSGTSHASTSTRASAVLDYSATNNFSANSGTISFWFNSRYYGGPSDISTILFRTGSDANNSLYGYLFNGQISVSIVKGGNTSSCGTGVSITRGVWNHAAVTWTANSGGSDGCQLYINGAASGTGPTSQTWSFSPSGNISVGYDVVNGALQANTSINDFRIYSSRLSASEITDMFNTPLGSYSEGPETPKDRPILHWKFNEGSGTTANDSSGNNLTGTISNATYSRLTISDKNINPFALNFNGTSAKVSRPYSFDSKLDPGTASFSISTWFKHSSTAPNSGTHTLISRFNSGGYKIYMNTSGYMCFGIDSDSTWTPSHVACSTSAQGSYADSKWHHLEGVKDTVNNTITLYIDGNQISQTAITDTGSLSGSSPTLYIGVDSDGSTNYWTGFIDEVQYFGVLRTAANVKADFNNIAAIKGVSTRLGDSGTLSSGLTGYWKLDEASGQALDYSGNGLNGTWNGAGTHYVPGKYGNGGLMSSSGDYIRTSGNTLLSTRSWTVSAWIYPTYLPNNGEWTSITFKAGTDPGVGTMSMQFQGPELDFNYYTGNPTPNCDGGWCRLRTTGGSFSTNKWYHLIFTHDDATGISKAYVNGILKVQDTFRANDSQINTGNGAFDIGNDGGYNEYFRGTIDEVRAYSRALTPAEVSQLYNWTPGPVGYWKMDEGSGSSVQDSSGSGNDTSSTGTSITTGKYGKARSLNGTNTDYITVTSSPSLQTAGTTVEAWVKFINKDKNTRGYLVTKGSASVQNYYVWYDSSSGVCNGKIVTGFYGGSYHDLCSTKNDFANNTWYHIAYTYDLNTMKVYINGVLDNSVAQTATPAKDTTAVGIGYDSSSGSTYHLNGLLDEVKIYNYARSNEQIVQDMNAGHPAPGSPVGSPYVWWKFNEGQGTLMHNSGTSGSSKDLTVSNPVWTNPGKNDRALSFNGSSTSGNAGNLSLNSDFTVETWMYINTYSASSPIQKSYDYAFELDGNNRLYFSTSCYWYNTYASPSTGAWHHIVMTVAGSKMTGYIDGRQEVSADTGCIQTSNTNNLYIGSYDGTQEYFNGRLDDLKLYNYALSAEQVKIAFNQASSLVLGELSTESDGLTSSNSNSRMYCPPGNTETNCAAGQNPSPGGEWNYENISGTTIYDTSGNSNNGTYLPNATNLTKGTGPIGKALYFNGADSVVNIPDNSTLKNSNALSFSTWIKFTSTANAQIATRIQSGLSSWKLNTNASSEISFTGDPDGNPVSGTSCTITSTNAQLQTNTWYHIGFSFSGGTVLLYKNGVVMSTTSTGSCSTLYDTGTSIQLGGAFDTNNFQGYLDLTRLYTYTRTQAQFAWDYNRGGPIGWWKFDERSGTTANDSSGNTNTGTLVNTPAWVDGKINSGIDFEYSNSNYITVANESNFDLTGSISISAWVKAESVPTIWSPIITKGDNAWRLTISGATGSKPNFSTNGLSEVDTQGNTDIASDGQWHHITAVYNATDGKKQIYIDGKLDKETSSVTGSISTNNVSVEIGRNGFETSRTFDGIIDDVRVYNYNLSAAQVKLLYNNGAAIRFAPLTGTP